MTRIIIGTCIFFLIAGFCGAFVKFSDSDSGTKTTTVKVKPKGYSPVVYTKKHIEKGTVLSESDVEVRKIWAMGSPLADQTFSTVDKVIGKKAKQGIQGGSFILDSFVE